MSIQSVTIVKQSIYALFLAYFKDYSKLLSSVSCNSPSHLAMTAVAKQLPITFTEVRAMSINSSIPIIIKMGSTGKPKEAAVPINYYQRSPRHASNSFTGNH